MADQKKVLFCTDLHGSEVYFGKVLASVLNLKVDVLLISGDITGKSIVPIVKLGGDRYITELFGRRMEGQGEKGLQELKDKIRYSGYYYYLATMDEIKELQDKREKVDELFTKVMCDTVAEWIQKIDRVLPKDVRVIINPGNDDRFDVDDVIKASDRVEYTLGKVDYLDDRHPMVACEWVNTTPFESPRECSEDELEKRLRKEIEKLGDYKNAVFDFHAPPYNTRLDLAPKLDKNLKPVTSFGQSVMIHVGSKAVLKVIKEYQPILGLHGHIHESAGVINIGRTWCVNPGSEYVEGIMHGYVVILKEDKIEYFPVMGG